MKGFSDFEIFSREMDVNRKKARGDQAITEISDLPDNAIDNILDRIPLGDAVRTSILSKNWGHHWTRLGNLVFDETFIEAEIMKGKPRGRRRDGEKLRSTYSDAIISVLRLHSGPVNKFVLHAPEFAGGPTINAQVNKWVYNVSRNGVKDITIEFRTTNGSSLSSDIFHCQELRRLSLHNCKVDLPSYFTGFSKLTSLHLQAFFAGGEDLNVLISSCPLLENLYLEFYKGSLSVNALRLKTLVVKHCILNGLTMQNVPNLVTATICGLYISSVQPRRIETFFDLMPNIESINMGSELFHVMDQHPIPKMLPTPLRCLKSLTLGLLGVADRRSMLYSFCILRSSPFLQTLNVDFTISPFAHSEDLADTVTFPEEQFSEPGYLKNLITVKVKRLEGIPSQIIFIIFILASCSALEELHVNVDQSVSKVSDLKIMTELNECSRASAKAKTLY